MTITIAMPQLGLTMTEATVSAWLKKPGDSVKKDEPVLSVSTDKVDMDIESTVDGVLREIIVSEGETVPVGTALAYIGAAGEEPLSPASNGHADPPRAIVTPDTLALTDISNNDEAELMAAHQEERKESVERSEHVHASPRAKRRASQLGVDLASVKGSGPGGRIIEKDVQSVSPGTPIQRASSVDSRRRQAIADRMVESIRNIPAFSVSVEVNAEKLVDLYESMREPISRRTGLKLTYTDLLLRALALSLADTPEVNAVWEEGAVSQRVQIDLGLAVATDRGVVAPTLAKIDSLSLQQLVIRRSELADKARQSRLTFDDLEGGVGTLSNLGMYRIDRFEGIITPGQSFILAVGKLRNRPWAESSLVIKPTVMLNLSVDHRVADGASAAVFLERIADAIENPYRLLWQEGNEK